MRTFGLSLLFLITSQTSYAANFEVKPFSFEGDMPFIESSNRALAEKMNTHIYEDLLDMPAPLSLQDKMAWPAEISFPPQSEIRYEVLRNDENILSIQIDLEGCGAYCESYTMFYNFDAQNGDAIEVTELLTAKGMQAVNKKLNHSRIEAMKNEIIRIKRAAKKHLASAKTEDKQDWVSEEDTIVLYESCMERFEHRSGDNDTLNISFDKLKITKTHISFIGDRCSNHAMRALDTLYNFENSFPIRTMKPYLSDYGKEKLFTKIKKH